MEVNCVGCAGCCIDWRPIAPTELDHERRGRWVPVDDQYNFVPLTRDDVKALLDAGLSDALTPRVWTAETGVDIDGYRLAAIEEKPVFFVGPRHAPKPVGPFGTDPSWLHACVFLEPTTLQCRIHDTDVYPTECRDYPGHNLRLGTDTECERVERAYDGRRLLDPTLPDDLGPLRLGPHAIGNKIFAYPNTEDLDGVIRRIAEQRLRHEDRASFVAAAAAGIPGSTDTDQATYDTALSTALETESWAGNAITAWYRLRRDRAPDPTLAAVAETARGAPPTPGWK